MYMRLDRILRVPFALLVTILSMEASQTRQLKYGCVGSHNRPVELRVHKSYLNGDPTMLTAPHKSLFGLCE
jgi:hypothetical protein